MLENIWILSGKCVEDVVNVLFYLMTDCKLRLSAYFPSLGGFNELLKNRNYFRFSLPHKTKRECLFFDLAKKNNNRKRSITCSINLNLSQLK